MKTINKSALVPHSAARMFALVNDVSAYPEFLPWCNRVDVLQAGKHELLARIHMSIGRLHQGFTTRNRMQPDRHISMELVEGPFRHLTGEWQFDPQPQGCRVSLEMQFEFKNRVLSLALGVPFHKIANSLMDAFIQRANDLHD